jgi:hypothetical protein
LRVETLKVHGPAAKPVLGLRRRPGRQFDLTPVVAAHARPMHGDLAAVEANLAFGRAPAVADAVLAAAIRGSGELLRIITEHLLDRADAGRQTEPLELSTSCQAVSRLGTSANNGVVVVLVMALLPFADSSPRA